MLHSVNCYESAGSTKAGFAMNGNASLILLDDTQELINDLARRSRTVDKVQIQVADACRLEHAGIVLRLVQSDDKSYVEFFENWDIVLWCISPQLVSQRLRRFSYSGSGSRRPEACLG